MRKLAYSCMLATTLLIGCGQKVPADSYHVQLINPTGKVIQEWDIKSKSWPYKYVKHGTIRLTDTKPHPNDYWWERDIVAPQHWYLKVTRKP